MRSIFRMLLAFVTLVLYALADDPNQMDLGLQRDVATRDSSGSFAKQRYVWSSKVEFQSNVYDILQGSQEDKNAQLVSISTRLSI